MKRNSEEAKDKKSAHQIDFKESTQLIKKFLLKRRFKYVWDNLMALYIENEKLIGNVEVLQTVKLAFKTLSKKLKVMSINSFVKKKPKIKQRVSKVYSSMITIFKAHQNVLWFQLQKENPEFFNMIFPSRIYTGQENDKFNNCLFKPSENRAKQVQNKEKQLISFIKNYLNVIIHCTIMIATQYSKKQAIKYIRMLNKFVKQFESKYFSLQKIRYEIVKLKIVEALNFTTEDLQIQFQMPIDLLGKIYRCALKWQAQKIGFHLKFFISYCILSMKNTPFSILQLKQILVQSTNILTFLAGKRHFRNQLFQKLIQQLSKQLLKFKTLRQQLNSLIRSRLPDQQFIVQSQLQIQEAKEMLYNPGMQSLQIGRNAENNNQSKKLRNNIIIRNIKEVSKSQHLPNEKIDKNNLKDINMICQILNFHKLNLIHSSSDQEQCQPKHLFQRKRLERIKALQMKQNQHPISLQTNIDSSVTQNTPEFGRSKSDYEQLKLLDNVLQTDIIQQYQKSAQYRTITEIQEKNKQITALNKQIIEKRAAKLQKLRDKAQNKLAKIEAYCQYKDQFYPQSHNWMKTTLRKPVKILPNKNILKLDGSNTTYLTKFCSPIDGNIQKNIQ